MSCSLPAQPYHWLAALTALSQAYRQLWEEKQKLEGLPAQHTIPYLRPRGRSLYRCSQVGCSEYLVLTNLHLVSSQELLATGCPRTVHQRDIKCTVTLGCPGTPCDRLDQATCDMHREDKDSKF